MLQSNTKVLSRFSVLILDFSAYGTVRNTLLYKLLSLQYSVTTTQEDEGVEEHVKLHHGNAPGKSTPGETVLGIFCSDENVL